MKKQHTNVEGRRLLEGLCVHFKNSGDNYLREVERFNQCLNCKKLGVCDEDKDACEDTDGMCTKCIPLKKPRTAAN